MSLPVVGVWLQSTCTDIALDMPLASSITSFPSFTVCELAPWSSIWKDFGGRKKNNSNNKMTAQGLQSKVRFFFFRSCHIDETLVSAHLMLFAQSTCCSRQAEGTARWWWTCWWRAKRHRSLRASCKECQKQISECKSASCPFSPLCALLFLRRVLFQWQEIVCLCIYFDYMYVFFSSWVKKTHMSQALKTWSSLKKKS